MYYMLTQLFLENSTETLPDLDYKRRAHNTLCISQWTSVVHSTNLHAVKKNIEIKKNIFNI